MWFFFVLLWTFHTYICQLFFIIFYQNLINEWFFIFNTFKPASIVLPNLSSSNKFPMDEINNHPIFELFYCCLITEMKYRSSGREFHLFKFTVDMLTCRCVWCMWIKIKMSSLISGFIVVTTFWSSLFSNYWPPLRSWSQFPLAQPHP